MLLLQGSLAAWLLYQPLLSFMGGVEADEVHAVTGIFNFAACQRTMFVCLQMLKVYSIAWHCRDE